MKSNKLAWIFTFSLIGTLFSGTLTYQKLFSGSCPLTEGCSYFLGYPTCYYGFGFFLALLILSFLIWKNKKTNLMKPTLYVSIASIIFSGIFSVKDLLYPNCPAGQCVYSLGIPSCIYGFFMFLIILILLLKSKK